MDSNTIEVPVDPKVYEVVLDSPVSTNHLNFSAILFPEGVPFKRKKAFIKHIPTTETKTYKAYATLKFREAMIPKFSGLYKIIWEVWGIYPNWIRRDLTNFEKATKDAFKEDGFVPDDNIVLWREQDWWIEKGVFVLKIRMYESRLLVGKPKGLK